jgi:hypothetical protein
VEFRELSRSPIRQNLYPCFSLCRHGAGDGLGVTSSDSSSRNAKLVKTPVVTSFGDGTHVPGHAGGG